jgi:ABC-2 type transport system ATP-binding protein
MIEVQDLVKWYGPTLAVDRISFSIPKGQIVGFLGPNGAGKTTTLRILTGFLPPTSGKAQIDGIDVVRQTAKARAKIGYLPESTPLYPEMRVEEYLHYRGKLQLMDRATRRKRIDELVGRCGLTKLRRRLIGQLSKGNRQRVGLAQALMHQPPVLILDEPTAGLDPNQISHVRDLINELREKHTVLISTHILREVENTADRVLIIGGGRIVADIKLDEVQRGVRVELQASDQTVRRTFERIKQVKQVRMIRLNDGWCRALVEPHGGADIRERLGQMIQTNGWVVRELRNEKASLEDLFLSVTSGQNESLTTEPNLSTPEQNAPSDDSQSGEPAESTPGDQNLQAATNVDTETGTNPNPDASKQESETD